jgi:hypothetical protein
MGTHSRLIIYRASKPAIYLWMRCDGYFSGVGNQLCKQIKLLLEKYTVEQINTMLDALDLEEADTYQDFKTEDLIEFIERKTTYGYDDSEDIAYEYKLDFTRGFLSGKGDEGVKTVTLAHIKSDVNLTDYETLLGHVSVKTVVYTFALLTAEEKKEALDKITAIMS